MLLGKPEEHVKALYWNNLNEYLVQNFHLKSYESLYP